MGPISSCSSAKTVAFPVISDAWLSITVKFIILYARDCNTAEEFGNRFRTTGFHVSFVQFLGVFIPGYTHNPWWWISQFCTVLNMAYVCWLTQARSCDDRHWLRSSPRSAPLWHISRSSGILIHMFCLHVLLQCRWNSSGSWCYHVTFHGALPLLALPRAVCCNCVSPTASRNKSPSLYYSVW
jgi:hypothetical protein